MAELTRTLISITLLASLIAGLSGCVGGLQNCRKYAGTAEFNICRAEQGDQQAQYEVGLAAHQDGDREEAIKWLEKAAKPRDNRTPVFIPKGNSGDVRIEMQETGLSKPGHYKARQLLEKIKE